MAVFAALLRAVNVGGTGKLPMAELKSLCDEVGLDNPRTYIQSGNVVFSTNASKSAARDSLASALAAKMGNPVDVFVRTPHELAKTLARNPHPDAPGNRVYVHFLHRATTNKALAGIVIPGTEQITPAGSEVFVHYPEGMGQSKLKLPFSKVATARNLNTVRKLLALCEDS